MEVEDTLNLKDLKVFVTGGAGFIGSEVVHQLLQSGSNVTVFDNFVSGKKEHLPLNNKKLKVIKGDIRDEDKISRSLKDQEVVIHLAALPFIPDSYYFPSDFFSVNTIGSVNMLWSSLKSKSVELFVQISSSEVYGSAQFVPMDENHPTAPHSTYAVSKLAGDRAVFTLFKENGYPVVILRLFNSYGPRYTEPYIIPEIMNQILDGTSELTLGNVNASRDFTFVSDSANAILKSITEEKAKGEMINVGSGVEITIRDLAFKIAKLTKRKIKIKYDESRERPYDVDRLVCNNKKAYDVLKWKPKINMNNGLSLTYKWATKNRRRFSSPFTRWYYKKNN